MTTHDSPSMGSVRISTRMAKANHMLLFLGYRCSLSLHLIPKSQSVLGWMELIARALREFVPGGDDGRFGRRGGDDDASVRLL